MVTERAHKERCAQDWFCMIDSCGVCNFVWFMGCDEDQMRELIEAATGVEMGGHEGFIRTGDRIFNLETLFNRRAGLTSADDTLPERMLKTPMPDGPAKGSVCELDKMLPPYYELRGWDKSGDITDEKATELGLMASLTKSRGASVASKKGKASARVPSQGD